MRLSECLNSSDINTLRKIAETHNFDCHRSSKNSLMQSILFHFNNREFVLDKLSSLDNQVFRETLLQLTADKRTIFSREDLIAIARRVAVGEFGSEKQLVNRLLTEGWLYQLGGSGGRNTYYLPEDLLRTIKEFVSGHLRSQVEKASEMPVVYRDDQFAIVRDTIHFLSFVKNNEVKLTMDGVIFKRQLNLLLERLEIRETPLANPGWRFGYGRRFHDYPDRFALIYDYCYNRQLISEEDSDVLVLSDKAEAWIQRDLKQNLLDMFRYWRLLYRRPIPKISLAVSTLARAAQGEWTLTQSMNRLLSNYVTEYYYDTQETVMETRIYQMMVNLGLLCRGKLTDGRDVIKMSDLGQKFLLEELTCTGEETAEPPSFSLLIQPNFDILLPAEETGTIDWNLSQFADLIRPDAMRLYRITKSSLQRGFYAGWTAKTIADFLGMHSGHAVPGNVIRMIEQWEKVSETK